MVCADYFLRYYCHTKGIAMADITVEQLADIAVFRVIGTLAFDELVDTVREVYPRITGHILWDLSRGSLGEITQEQFNLLPGIVKESMAERVGGKNAYVSPHDRDYGLLRMYEVITRFRSMPYESNVYRTIDDALNWLL